MRNPIFLLFVMASMLFIQCSKDSFTKESSRATSNISRSSTFLQDYESDFSVLKSAYGDSAGGTYSPASLNILWNENFHFSVDTNFLILDAIPENGQTDGNYYEVILVRDSLNSLSAYTILSVPDMVYYNEKGVSPNGWDYTGDIRIYDIDGQMVREYRVNEGINYYLKGQGGNETEILNYPIVPPTPCPPPNDGQSGGGGDPGDCYDFTKGKFWRDIGSWLSGLGKWFQKSWNQHDNNSSDYWKDSRYGVQSNAPRFSYYGAYGNADLIGGYGGDAFIQDLECLANCFWCNYDI